jgi:diguanylate cyclase (GGDEF)-like protein/PAS domain S-box-containing protein
MPLDDLGQDMFMARVQELAMLRRLLDGIPALIGYWDRHLRNVVANHSYIEYFGMTPEEIRGRHIREVLGDEIYALNLPWIEGVLAGEEQLFHRTLIDRHGHTRHTQASYVPDVVDGEVAGFYVQVTDVTARVEAERARDDAVRLYQISMANAPFGMAVFDTRGRGLKVNRALCELLACDESDLIGTDFRPFIHPDELSRMTADFVSVVKGEAQESGEFRYLRRDGTTIWMQRNAVLVPGTHGADDVLVIQFQDVTARRQAEAELARLAVTDALTGLRNRHALHDCLSRHRTESRGAPIGIVLVDLDGFKEINDRHGHTVGDVVLAAAAGRLAQVIVPPESAYRLGGDEFVVVVPTVNAQARIAAVAARIRNAVTGDYDIDDVSVPIGASVGFAVGLADDAEALLRVADRNMYEHKRRRRRPIAPRA